MANEKVDGQTRNTVPDDLLAILVCPVDHTKVALDGGYLVCPECGRAYPIRDGIPVMLVEEAEQRTPAHPAPVAETSEAVTEQTAGAE